MFTEEVHKIAGVEGTLAIPAGPVAVNRIVFILHGVGGHRDYCYQKELGQTLPAKLGISTFRFDFRNCGNSDFIPNPENGRRIAGSDGEDVSALYQHFCVEQDYELVAIVGHSRGASVMFSWAKNHPDIYIPYLINCSGRFDAWKYRELVLKNNPTLVEDGGYRVNAKRFGKYGAEWIPLAEVDDFSAQNSPSYGNIDPRIQVFTIFGTKDHIVPVADSGKWANTFDGRHKLQLIMEGDHNFYGPRGPDNKKVSYNPEVVQAITEYLAPEQEYARFLSKNKYSDLITRFKEVEGVPNFRDFGGYGLVKPGILFRSAVLNEITPKGIHQLREFGIKHVFDLRSTVEIEKSPTPELPGIQVIHSPVFENKDVSPQGLYDMFSNEKIDGVFTNVYRDMLKGGGSAFNKVFSALRDYPDQGILIHCTAGKDRTGLVCAAILLLLGVEREIICRDYELTTTGLTEFRKKVMELFAMTEDHPDFKKFDLLLSSKYEAMQATITTLSTEWNGIEHYLKQECQLTDGDLATIRHNLLRRPLSHL